MTKHARITAVVAAVLTILTGHVTAAGQVHRDIGIPAELSATIQTTGCTAIPGPQVSIQSELLPAMLRAQLIFTDPIGQPAPEPFVAEQVVIPANAPIPLPAQSVVAGLSDDPFMWLQLTDTRGRPLTSEIFLGRCSEAPFTRTAALSAPAEARAEISASGCESAAGPTVAVDGRIDLTGVNGKLILRSSGDPVGRGGLSREIDLDLVVLPPGQSYAFPQESVQGQVGPNPLISLQLRDGDDREVGGVIRFGRCAALAN